MKESKIMLKPARKKGALVAMTAVAMAGVLAMAGCAGGASSTSASGSAASTSASASASSSSSASITAVGSTALQPLVEAAAEQYMSENSGVQITVQGGGSGQGITQISEGAVQIGDSDVFAEAKLKDPSKAADLVDNKVAVVGMGPVCNKDVTVDSLTMDQLRDIFTGKVTNWKEVGGKDEEIVVINRASGSGTRATFEDAVLGDTKVPDTFKPQEQDSSGTVQKMVSETPGAISYLAFSYYNDDIKALEVDGVAPTANNVSNNEWKIWSYEHMYIAKDADAATKAFIDYMMGDKVQNSLVTSNGYISVKDMKVARDADGNVTKL